MLTLGTPMPAFSLPDTVSGRVLSSDALRSAPATVVAFICNHCPYVLHIQSALAEFGRFCQGRGVAFVAISSNDVETYPQDGPELMAQEAQRAGYVFPYLYDQSQAVAEAFQATCTPDFFVFDGAQRLAYRGQFDDSRPKNGKPVTGQDVRAAVEALLAGGAPSPAQKPSIGCGIKWKGGVAPAWA
jgi:peroxiredoxin